MAREVAIGIGIAGLGVGPWALLAPLNASYRPDLPWAAGVSLVLLALLACWLAGRGPPGSSRDRRWRDLRLWTAGKSTKDWFAAETLVLVLVWLAITAVWIVASLRDEPSDLSQYPTTAFRISAFLMTPIVAGVAEEMAFRGYLLSRLERFGPTVAITVTSLTFAVAHITHGVGTVLMLGPGFFLVSVLYCTLVRQTGSILPGMVLHTLGDLAYLVFVVLRGDIGLLLAAN